MKIAFATSREFADGHHDDLEAARLAGADFRVWNDPAVQWQRYDRVVIRSTWDYTTQLDAYLDWCQTVGPERLRNRPDLVNFSSDKRYLDQLRAPTVPTIFVAEGDPLPRSPERSSSSPPYPRAHDTPVASRLPDTTTRPP
jgi:hypothetical protein